MGGKKMPLDDRGFSFFTSVFEKTSTNIISFGDFVNKISAPEPKILEKIMKIRLSSNKKERAELKKSLPAIMVSHSLEKKEIQEGDPLNGFFQIDFDNIEDPAALKSQLMEDPYLAAVFISPSGKGVKGLIKTDYRIAGKEIFNDLKYYLEMMYPDADKSCFIENKLCFLSYDPDIYVNENAQTLSRDIYTLEEIYSKKERITELDQGNLKRILAYMKENQEEFFYLADYHNKLKFGTVCKRSGVEYNVFANLLDKCPEWMDESQSRTIYKNSKTHKIGMGWVYSSIYNSEKHSEMKEILKLDLPKRTSKLSGGLDDEEEANQLDHLFKIFLSKNLIFDPSCSNPYERGFVRFDENSKNYKTLYQLNNKNSTLFANMANLYDCSKAGKDNFYFNIYSAALRKAYGFCAQKKKNQFDKPKHLVFFHNGVYDLRDNEWKPNHEIPRLDIDPSMIYEGKEVGDPVFFKKFINDLFPLDVWGTDGQDYIYKLLAVSTLGHMRTRKMINFIGAGANGKSTLTKIMVRIAGEDSEANFKINNQDRRFADEIFDGSKIKVDQDFSGAKLSKEIVERIKSLTGDDSVPFEKKGGGFYHADLSRFQLVINSNVMLLPASGMDKAYTDRLLPVPLDVVFNKVDQTISEKLNGEISKIRVFLLDYLVKVFNEGVSFLDDNVPKPIQKAKMEYYKSDGVFAEYFSDSSNGYIDDNNEPIHKKIAFSDLWDDFSKWIDIQAGKDEYYKRIRPSLKRTTHTNIPSGIFASVGERYGYEAKEDRARKKHLVLKKTDGLEPTPAPEPPTIPKPSPIDDPKIWAYDIECYAGFTYIFFKNTTTNEEKSFEFHDIISPEKGREIRDFMEDNIEKLVAYNQINYDNVVLSKIMRGDLSTTLAVKEFSDKLINDKGFKKEEVHFGTGTQIDLHRIADAPAGGLKLQECRIDYPVVLESEIDFNKRVETKEEKEIIRKYCKNDVGATIALYKSAPIQEKIEAKKEIENYYKIDNLMNQTESSISSIVLSKLIGSDFWGKTPIEYDSIMGKDILSDKIHFENEDLKKLHDLILNYDFKKGEGFSSNIYIGKINIGVAEGGLHSEHEKVSISEGRLIDIDVTSFYPSIMINERIAPANFKEKFLQVFADLVAKRKELKKQGSPVAKSLKIVLNSAYGKFGAKNGFLRDEKAGKAVTMNGQLFLLMLAEKIDKVGLKIIQANTDGFIVKINSDAEYEQLKEIKQAWEQELKLELEETEYTKAVIKSSNQYVLLGKNGKLKKKGDYFSDSFEINKGNGPKIIAKAVNDFFIYGIEPERTIESCQDVFQFVEFAKREEFDGEGIKPQKCINRWVYGYERNSLGFKTKAGTTNLAKNIKLANEIDKISVQDINKKAYILMAKKNIENILENPIQDQIELL